MFKEELGKDSKYTYLGRVDNQSDDAEGGRQAVEQALIRFPKVDAIVAYNDPTALGAYSAISARGKIDIKIVGNQMQPEAVTSIVKGNVDGSWDFNPVESGISLAKLTISILKKEPKANWSKTIQTPAKFYDASTISDFVPWTTRSNKIK
jgi:ABC-type sugar transport system substrate-binding protein